MGKQKNYFELAVMLLIALVLNDPKVGLANDIENQSSLTKAKFDSSLSVLNFQLSSSIVNRQAVDTLHVQSISIENVNKIWAFAAISCGDCPESLSFDWYYNGAIYLEFEVNVRPSNNWRTYSYVTPRLGNWAVQLVNKENGVVLKEIEFRIH